MVSAALDLQSRCDRCGWPVITGKTSESLPLLIGIALLAIGLLFKVGAVPFHQWVPDVYQGSPTPLTAFMAATVKIAAFGALLRVLYVAFGGMRWDWEPMLWIIAILSMFVGAALAITQSDIKRLLAYSSVAHTGFILTGVLGVQASDQLAVGEITSLQAVLFYLTTYGFATTAMMMPALGEYMVSMGRVRLQEDE